MTKLGRAVAILIRVLVLGGAVGGAGLSVGAGEEPGTEVRKSEGDPDGQKVTVAGKDDELTLALQGPFADRTKVPFEKTEASFVQPHSVELRDEKDGTSLRVRFRFMGPKDLASGLRVAISHKNGESVLEDDAICADRRFLTQMPLWKDAKDDAFIGLAEFELPLGIRENLDRLQVTFGRVRLVQDSAQPLTEAAWAQAIALIAKLDDERFEQKEAAARELAALGEPFLPYLGMLRQALAEEPNAPAKLRVELGPIETAIRPKAVERLRAAVLADLEEALKCGYGYEPSSQRVRRALTKQHISFEFVDMPLSKALDWVSVKTGVAIVVDPEVAKKVDLAITLRVTDMSADLALGLICRLCELDSMFRKNGVVVGIKHPYPHPLECERRLLSLPVEPGSADWTEDEVRRLCGLYRVTKVQLEGPNSARVIGEHGRVDELAQVLPCFGKPQPMPAADLPEWVTTIEKELDAKVTLKDGITVKEALREIRTQIKVDLIVDPRTATGAPDTLLRKLGQSVKDQSAREALRTVCSRMGARIGMLSKGLYLSTYVSRCDETRLVLPLGEALKTGVSQDELYACLRRVLEGMPGSKEEQEEAVDPAKMAIRGRWFAKTDPWTLQRLGKVLDETIRTRRVPPVPPPPWFMEVEAK